MNNKPQVGVIGCGFVGQAIARGFNLFSDVRTNDIDPRRCANSFDEVLRKSQYIFVCLPTPMEHAEGGKADLSIIRKFFKDVEDNRDEEWDHDSIFIIKSTVPIGTTKSLSKAHPNLRIVHSPEFLTARSAALDFITPARNIVGADSEDDRIEVKELYEERFPGVPCYVMGSKESEFVKYAANCFFATKVMFFNEMKVLSDRADIDWDTALEGIMSDGRIAKSHYQVPGHDGDYGYGGSCFPKDINALIKTMEDKDFDPLVLKAVWEQNKNLRQNWDWADNPSAVSNGKKNEQ